MKFIKTAKEIVSLENVMKVSKWEQGTGAKSNPFRFRIDITYYNNMEEWIWCDDDRKLMDEIFEEIAKILSEKA